MSDHGSRKSVSHIKSGKDFFTFNAMRCILCGGPVDIIASTWCFESHFFRNLEEGRIQADLASGMKIFPLTHLVNSLIRDLFPPFLFSAPVRPVDFPPPIRETTLDGSNMGNFSTVTPSGISFNKLGSTTGTSGFSGVKITGSHPKLFRYFENFNQRCTPAPPDGGQ